MAGVLTRPTTNVRLNGSPGVSQRIAAGGTNLTLSRQDSVSTARDSLRFQLGDYRAMKQWQHGIISYYEDNNLLDSLSDYATLIKDCNKEAYNTIALYLMYRHRASKEEAIASQWKNNLLSNNPEDIEIKCRVMYFDYEGRILYPDSLNPISHNYISKKDSTDLMYIINSGTSAAGIAYTRYRLYYPQISTYPVHTYQVAVTDCGPDCKKEKEKFLKNGLLKQLAIDIAQTKPQLAQNIPNPAENQTLIPYFIPAEMFNAQVSFIVINNMMTGEEMARINLTEGGTSFINLDLSRLSSGIYSYTLVVNGIKVDIKKMAVVK